MSDGPPDVTLTVSLTDAARLLLDDLRSCGWGPAGTKSMADGEIVLLLDERLRQAVAFELSAAEALAIGRGDRLHRQGREAEADVCYGLAAQIRHRREAYTVPPATP